MERQGRLNRIVVDSEKATKIAFVSENSRQKRLNRERWALETARLYGVLVPLVIDYYVDKIDEEEREILILRTIQCEALNFEKIDLNIQTMRMVGRQLSFLGPINNVGFGWPHPEYLKGEFETWQLFLCFFVKKYGKRLIRNKIISKRMLGDFLKVVMEFEFETHQAFLIHRDIKLSNILQTQEGPYIIDWENALLGDSLFDLAQYGANYNRDELWYGLADGFGFSGINTKYIIYEAIALIGVIDFHRKQKLDYSLKRQQLYSLFQELHIV